ncbi:MAG: flagellar motor switch protein FliN [Ignavibacteriales bacterium]|nr:flagellar motor switch protein FliN [Ignavibacteriales bacterium]
MSQMESSEPQVEVQKAEFDTLQSGPRSEVKERKLDILLDLKLPLNIELGRTSMQIKDILELERGSLIEIDKYATEPVDIWINGKKMAEGEVIVVDKHFGVRITNLVETAERIKGLGK